MTNCTEVANAVARKLRPDIYRKDAFSAKKLDAEQARLAVPIKEVLNALELAGYRILAPKAGLTTRAIQVSAKMRLIGRPIEEIIEQVLLMTPLLFPQREQGPWLKRKCFKPLKK